MRKYQWTLLITWEAQVLPAAIADLGVAELGAKRPGVMIITFLIRTITGFNSTITLLKST
ncbi:MAG: hypothetical protein WAM88_07850 [Nitrososphaeraceae archaeon]